MLQVEDKEVNEVDTAVRADHKKGSDSKVWFAYHIFHLSIYVLTNFDSIVSKNFIKLVHRNQ